jgi:hypothetical protein
MVCGDVKLDDEKVFTAGILGCSRMFTALLAVKMSFSNTVLSKDPVSGRRSCRNELSVELSLNKSTRRVSTTGASASAPSESL